MRPEDPSRLVLSRSLQPARIAAVVAVLASATVVTAAGVTLGGAIQDRLEAGPTAAETRALDRIDEQHVVTPKSGDARGPNRADLGGGRADLGAAR